MGRAPSAHRPRRVSPDLGERARAVRCPRKQCLRPARFQRQRETQGDILWILAFVRTRSESTGSWATADDCVDRSIRGDSADPPGEWPHEVEASIRSEGKVLGRRELSEEVSPARIIHSIYG